MKRHGIKTPFGGDRHPIGTPGTAGPQWLPQGTWALDWIAAAVELGIDVFDANPPVRPLQRMMADRALHRRTTSAQHPNSERLDREPGPNDPAVAG